MADQQDLDAQVEELLNGNEPEQTDDSAAQPESTPAQEAQTVADLEAVLPDVADIPEGYRKKKLADVIRVAEQHKYEAGVAATRNQQWNQMQAERDAARLALNYLQQQQAAPQPAPQQPREPDDAFLQRLAAQPREVLSEEFDQRLRPVQQELEQTRAMLVRTQADNAQIIARDSLGINPQVWEEIRGPVATFMAYQRWPIEDPRAWSEAARVYVDNAMRTAQRFAPQPQAPAPEVPRQGAPPNGSARSQSRPAGTKLRAGLKNELATIATAMGLDEKHAAELERYAADNIGGISG